LIPQPSRMMSMTGAAILAHSDDEPSDRQALSSGARLTLLSPRCLHRA
jgi:hypothetical protein